MHVGRRIFLRSDRQLLILIWQSRGSPRDMLTHPVHFSCPADLVWPELRESFPIAAINGDLLSQYSGGILNSWVVRTAYELRLRGARISIGPGLKREAINLVSVRDFGRRDRDPHAFVVIPRGDAHDPALADFTIEQNFQRPETRNRASIAHWPQPGIVRRDPNRGTRLEMLTFKGRVRNLDPVFREQAFRDALAQEGIAFEIDAFADLRGQHSWNDYHEADAVLAVRNMTLSDARGKPASKLINAWFAEVPALLGPEPAFQELRRSELDFIEVRTPAEALNALKRLKESPALYQAMVENGRVRREDFTEDALSARWAEVLNGAVARAFERWKREWRAVHIMRYGAMCLREPLSKRLYRRAFNRGPRLIEE
jgi:hypothetical protein